MPLAPRGRPGLALLAAVTILALPRTARVWFDDPSYSLGPIVWAWVLWVAWRRRGDQAPPGWWAAAAITLLVAAWYLASPFLAALAVAAAVVHAGLVAGWPGIRVPALALLLTVPPPGSAQALAALQGLVADGSRVALGLAGVPVLQDSLVLVSQRSGLVFEVAPLCAGLSILLAVLALLAMAAWHLGVKPGRLAWVLAVSAGVTVTLNILRIVVLVVATERWGPKVVDGLGHEAVGIAVSLVAVLVCLPLLTVGRRRRRGALATPTAEPSTPAPEES